MKVEIVKSPNGKEYISKESLLSFFKSELIEYMKHKNQCLEIIGVQNYLKDLMKRVEIAKIVEENNAQI